MLRVNLPREAIYALWLAKGQFISGSINFESCQATATLRRSTKPRNSPSKHSIWAGRMNLEPSQATASKHWSPDRVWVRVSVRVSVRVVGFRHHGQNARIDALSRCNHASHKVRFGCLRLIQQFYPVFLAPFNTFRLRAVSQVGFVCSFVLMWSAAQNSWGRQLFVRACSA